MKGKLEIPLTDTTQDADLQATLGGVENYLADRLGIAYEGEERTDRFQRVRRGRKVSLTRWPVSLTPALVIAGKMHGDTDWTPLTGELIDPAYGIVVVEPPGAYWPPLPYPQRRELGDYWDWTWDLVTITYTAGLDIDGSAITVSPRLVEVAASLTAYLYSQSKTNGTASKSVRGISEVYRDDAIPPWLAGMLASLERTQETSWVA